jgi:hypothetical protein
MLPLSDTALFVEGDSPLTGGGKFLLDGFDDSAIEVE